MENNKQNYQAMNDSDCIFTDEQIDNFFSNLRKYQISIFPFLNDSMSDREIDERINEFLEENPEEKQKLKDDSKKFEDFLRSHPFRKRNDD